MSKYIDENGLQYLWSKIKTYVASVCYNKTEIDTKLSDIGSVTIEEITESEIDEIIKT